MSERALEGYSTDAARDAMEYLFRLEEAFGIAPDSVGALRIDPKAKGAQKLDAAIKAWQGAREDLKSGKMTQDDYKSQARLVQMTRAVWGSE